MVGMQFAACQHHSMETHLKEHPVEVHAVDGSNVNRVTMTDRAIERLGLQTGPVTEETVSRPPSPRRVVPLSALIYDPAGQTWVYTNVEPRTFMKHKVDVAYIEGGRAVLNDGPPAGTLVVTMAAAEVYGADSGVGH
jgi:hypothetical protein